MPISLQWSDIAVRLLCTLLTGVLIGFNRGQHGRPAGLRTTTLVSLAACLSMLQVNLLLPIAGKAPDSFVVLDLMRLPLGILSGMGFIGAGAIVRRDNFVVGVTTAATLWFVTVAGLCFGGGQILLGLIGLVIALIVLEGLKVIEDRIDQDQEATLSIIADPSGPTERDVRSDLAAEGFRIKASAIVYSPEAKTQELSCDVQWRSKPGEIEVPRLVHTLASRAGVIRIAWSPEIKLHKK